MPNANSRFIGYNGIGYLDEEVPNIKTPANSGIGGRCGYSQGDITPFFYVGQAYNGQGAGDRNVPGPFYGINFSLANSKYKDDGAVRPLTLRTNVIIKY